MAVLILEDDPVHERADHPRGEDNKGVYHALDQRQSHHVAIGHMANLMAQYGPDFVLVKAA